MPLDARLPLSSTEEGTIGLINDYSESVKQQIKTIILTSPGERIYDINYGVGLKRILFEQNNSVTIAELQNRIKSQIKQYAPYVVLENIKVDTSQMDSNVIQIQIQYSIKTLQNYQDSLSLEFTNVPTI